MSNLKIGSREKQNSSMVSMDYRSERQKNCEAIIKSRKYEWAMLLVSVAYLINLIVCAFFEDKYIFDGLEVSIGKQSTPGFFLVFDIIKLVICFIYMADNTAYACTYGLKKRVRIYHLTFETLLIAVIMSLCIITINDTSIRFKEFYIRLLDIIII